MKKTPLFYNKEYKKYKFGSTHPFNPQRFSDFVNLVKESEVMSQTIETKNSPKAKKRDLQLVHTPEYIEKVYRKEAAGDYLTMDTPVKKGAPDAARLIVGGSLEAGKISEKGGTALNMGGLHHSGRASGEGFCIFNDVAVAAQYLVNKGKKVCVYDTDAHHGNGTMDIFYREPEVLFISLHQDPRTLYPGKGRITELGEGPGEGYSINIPLPRNSTISEYYLSIEEVVKPLVEEFSPDVLIRNGGADPHPTDTLTNLRLDMNGLEYLGRTAREMAQNAGAGHIDLLVSGYGNRVLEGWQAITIGSLNLDMKIPSDPSTGSIDNKPIPSLQKTISSLKDLLKDYWNI